MDHTERIWLTVDEAADVLGVPLAELHRLIDSGRLRAYKIGRVVRIRRQDLAGLEGGSPDGHHA
jgi:excisionase family DNA binding protein